MTTIRPEIAAVRTPEFPVDGLFVNRWSPRAMSGEPITEQELRTLLEAVRWAPSSYNEQPWRIVYARNGTPHWATLFGLLAPPNQAWAHRAAVLLVFYSRETFSHSGKPNTVHVFDAGSAWMSLALQAEMLGLVAHGMAGFDRDRALKELAVPAGYAANAMAAVGRRGRTEDLPEPLRSREAPSGRMRITEFAAEGRFPSA